MDLLTCHLCDGLIPRGRVACPHCEAPRPRGRVWRAACAGGALMTLMACYGMIARPLGPSAGPDRDHDGVGADLDCDDTRPDVFPGAADLDGDGVDQNCDGADGWRDPDAPPPPAAVATDPAPADPPPDPPPDPPADPTPLHQPAAIAIDPP